MKAVHAMKNAIFLIFACVILFTGSFASVTANPQDQKMAWWRDARFGMFIHWGAYAQLHGWWQGQKVSSGTGGEWIMNDANISLPDYETYAATPFNPTQFNAHTWVGIAKAAGQKYIVITSKHHEGFSMFTTSVPRFSPYDIVEFTQWKQDPLAALATECRTQGLKFCVYYSIQDWHHPSQSNYGATISNKTQYVTDMKAQLAELIQKYNVNEIWFDGEWQSWWTTADGNDLHAYLLGLKPDLIVNNRIGKRAVTDGDFGTPEQTIPAGGLDYDWESCMTINDTWGYVDYDTSWKSSLLLLTNLVDCASKGGNYLLNVGPTQYGIIPQPEVNRLDTMGMWLTTYGESIYGTKASIFSQTFSWGKVTSKTGRLYLHVLAWPGGSHQISISALKNTVNKVFLLNDTTKTCAYTVQNSTMTITLPATAPSQYISVVALSLNGDPRTSDSLYINNTNPLISYNGNAYGMSTDWGYSSGRGNGDYMDDVHYTQTNGDSFSCSFNGIGVDYITEKNSDEGQVDIYIDGALVTTVDCSNASRLAQQVVFHRDLASGNHTIKGVKKSGTYMLLDALRIRIDPNATPVAGTPNTTTISPLTPQREVIFRCGENRFIVPNGISGTSFAIVIYNLSGKCLKKAIISGRSFNPKKDFGISEGAFLARIKALP
jgi:alpha-L-fucosidase